jgi:hypothetical protein
LPDGYFNTIINGPYFYYLNLYHQKNKRRRIEDYFTLVYLFYFGIFNPKYNYNYNYNYSYKTHLCCSWSFGPTLASEIKEATR